MLDYLRLVVDALNVAVMQIKKEAVRDLLSPIAEGADRLFEPFDPWSLQQFIEFIKTAFNGWQIRILNHFCFVKPGTENLFQLINFAQPIRRLQITSEILALPVAQFLIALVKHILHAFALL